MTVPSHPRIPSSTYRLQFHAGFTFRDAAAIVPYLHDLGVTHLYASPYLKARPGSTHGYDVIDHCTLNPELGTEADYNAWIRAMQSRGMGHVLDTVPNHVGVATNDNTWWNDVLEHGPASRYAHYFDIAWRGSPRPELHDKVLLPLLGGRYGEVLEKGELRLKFEGGAFAVYYYDRRFPISPRSYGKILGLRPAALREALAGDSRAQSEYRDITALADDLADPAGPNLERITVDKGNPAGPADEVKRRLAGLASESNGARRFIEQNVTEFNGRPGEPRSFDLLEDLLNEQSYRLSYWRVAPDEINYRRFFDINDLAALSMERPEVFRDTHAFILRLVAEGKIDGLRIDHPDGLYDPEDYFRRLQLEYARAVAREAGEFEPSDEAAKKMVYAAPLYVAAEKILAPGEPLPPHWAVHGTSGYDFLNMVNGLFVDQANEAAFTKLYKDWVGDDTAYEELVYRKKLLILDIALASELQMLAHRLDRFAQKHRRSRDYTLAGLRQALRETIACFPVYRSYVSREGVRGEDRRYMDTAVERAIRRNPKADASAFHFVRDVVLQQYPEASGEADREEQLAFAGKFQQVTAPVTAKGVEDTAFYIYNRLVSLNEVGGEPGHFGVSPEALHEYLRDRQAKWPYAMSALSTHDTKRSEDVRARLNVLSEIPGEWAEAVLRWRGQNAPHRRRLEDGLTAPRANDEYLIYQTLVGAWPLEPYGPDEFAAFVQRVQAYMEKAMREAKVYTTWVSPIAEYEGGVKEFLARILDERTAGEFLRDFRPFQRRVSEYGLLNSLSQTVLRLTAPGVPDTYQESELWDFSLVDPDNRRPVDYERRRRILQGLPGRVDADLTRDLVARKEDGRVKLFVTRQALACRRDHHGLFSAGEYFACEATGEGKEHVFGFARRRGDVWAVVAVPRLVTSLPASLGDAALLLPAETPPGLRFRNVFTGEQAERGESQGRPAIRLADAFGNFPVALLVSRG